MAVTRRRRGKKRSTRIGRRSTRSGGGARQPGQLFLVNTLQQQQQQQQQWNNTSHGKFNRKRVIDLSKWLEGGGLCEERGGGEGKEEWACVAEAEHSQGFVASLASCHQIIIS